MLRISPRRGCARYVAGRTCHSIFFVSRAGSEATAIRMPDPEALEEMLKGLLLVIKFLVFALAAVLLAYVVENPM